VNATAYGAIESLAEARLCGEVFRQHRDQIDGIIVTLPNFGDERAVANAIRFAALDVPVLVHAFPDDPVHMAIDRRRDSFCGKMSVCNNLRQYGISYSLTTQHTSDPASASFKMDLRAFADMCRLVRGLRRARIGLIGARPANFTTVRFSEKLLEHAGISVETLDLSDVFGRIDRLDPNDTTVEAKRLAIERYSNCGSVPEAAVTKMAKLGVVIDQWRIANQLDAISIQCWSSMQENFGIVPCTVMSMASDGLMPAACEARRHRCHQHAGAGPRLRQPCRVGGLEQQLRRRPRQSGGLPLLQLAEEHPGRRETADGQQCGPCQHLRRREGVWHDRRARKARPVHVSACLYRRRGGSNLRLHG